MDASKIQLSIIENSEGHTLLEGPHWDCETQSLYYVDITECSLFRYDYAENKIYRAFIEGEEKSSVSVIIPVEGQANHFVVTIESRIVLISWNGKSPVAKKVRVCVDTDQEMRQTRINDGKADPRGRFFAGTLNGVDPFNTRVGQLFRFSSGRVTKLRGNVAVSNGLTWNERAGKFYYVDTKDLNVKEFDYDVKTGDISNPSIVIELNEADQVMFDGMTIDGDGLLYVAGLKVSALSGFQHPAVNAGRIFVVDPERKVIVREVMFPVGVVTSAAFGGPNLDELFVTTAAFGESPQPCGSLFKVTGLGVRGTKMSKVKL